MLKKYRRLWMSPALAAGSLLVFGFSYANSDVVTYEPTPNGLYPEVVAVGEMEGVGADGFAAALSLLTDTGKATTTPDPVNVPTLAYAGTVGAEWIFIPYPPPGMWRRISMIQDDSESPFVFANPAFSEGYGKSSLSVDIGDRSNHGLRDIVAMSRQAIPLCNVDDVISPKQNIRYGLSSEPNGSIKPLQGSGIVLRQRNFQPLKKAADINDSREFTVVAERRPRFIFLDPPGVWVQLP